MRKHKNKYFLKCINEVTQEIKKETQLNVVRTY